MAKKTADKAKHVVPVLNSETIGRFLELARNGVNVLITGPHGIGKTTMHDQLCKELGYKGAYINCPAADFFVDWLGIPAPEDEPEFIRTVRWLANRGADYLATQYVKSQTGMVEDDCAQTVAFINSQPSRRNLQFLRPRRMDGVQFAFFDEINREADPRFVDAVMELIQFKTINGEPLPDLKLVWAAQNPPNSIYKVKELDTPVIDKFGAHIYIEGRPDRGYFLRAGYDEHVVTQVIHWYEKDLNDEQRLRCSPRMIESIIKLAVKGLDLDFSLLQASMIPGHMLSAKLKKIGSSHRYSTLDLAAISADTMKCITHAQTDIDFNAHYTDLLLKKDANAMLSLRTIPVFLSMTFEFQNKCMTDPDWVQRMVSATQSVGSDVSSLQGFSQFVEMLRQFAPKP